MWEKIMKEIAHKRYAGPFEEIPFENFVQSPIGLVPKASDQTRLIFHLSYHFGKSGFGSVNSYMPDHFCKVKYKDLDYTVRESLHMLRALGDLKSKIWFSKTDLKSAFHILGLKVGCFWLLVMVAYHPLTGKRFYFVDKCLPFGHSISCALFQKFSDALAHILMHKTSHDMEIPTALANYLDDFLFAALKRAISNGMLQQFLDICHFIGVPVALDKTEWATLEIIFLGILLQGELHLLVVPEDKRIRALHELHFLNSKKKASIRDLQKLSGFSTSLTGQLYQVEPSLDTCMPSLPI